MGADVRLILNRALVDVMALHGAARPFGATHNAPSLALVIGNPRARARKSLKQVSAGGGAARRPWSAESEAQATYLWLGTNKRP